MSISIKQPLSILPIPQTRPTVTTDLHVCLCECAGQRPAQLAFLWSCLSHRDLESDRRAGPWLLSGVLSGSITPEKCGVTDMHQHIQLKLLFSHFHDDTLLTELLSLKPTCDKTCCCWFFFLILRVWILCLLVCASCASLRKPQEVTESPRALNAAVCVPCVCAGNQIPVLYKTSKCSWLPSK